MKKLFISLVMLFFATALTFADTPSTLVNTQCNTTQSAIDQLIYCYIKPDVAKYKFEISNGTDVQYHEVPINKFRFTDLTEGVTYNTTYQIRVATRTSTGTFGDYGTACTITTPSASTNRLLDTFCNKSLSSINSYIYSFRDDNAEAYQFEFIDGSNTEVIERSSNKIALSNLDKVKANATYIVRVRNKYNGIWSTYGPVCTVTTPEFTVLVPTQCGQTLGAINSLIYSYTKSDTDQYTFEVSDGTNTETIVASSNKFSLTQLAGGAKYNTTYTIRVAIRQNGTQGDFGRPCTVTTPGLPLTQLTDSRCGVTLNTLDQTIYCYLQNNVQEYIFEINDGTNTVTHNATANRFALTDVEGLAKYSTTYRIRVATIVAGQQSDLGPECAVTTPNAPLTRLVDMQCGIQLESVFTMMYCYRNNFAEEYGFEVTHNGISQEIVSTGNNFRFSSVNELKYDTDYQVRAKAKYNGQWTEFGESCIVRTPIRTKLVSTQCDKELNTLYQPIYCYIKPDVESYVFEVNNGEDIRTYTSTSNKFDLSKVLGADSPPDPPGTPSFVTYEREYRVRVALKREGKEREGYGEACVVTTPIKPKSKLVSTFCDSKLEKVDDWIYCYRFDGAERYRFEITNDWDSFIYETGTNKFKISDIEPVRSDAYYMVRVAVKYHGEWVEYGDSCVIETPVHTKLVNNQCDQELAALDAWVYAYIKPGIDEYTFEVSNEKMGIRTVKTSINKIRLSDLNGGVNYGEKYTVRVAATSKGELGDFGVACDVQLPYSKVVDNQCGAQLSQFDDIISVETLEGVVQYKYEISHDGQVITVHESESNAFRLSEMINVQSLRYYDIRVAVKSSDKEWGEYGPLCRIQAPYFQTSSLLSKFCGQTYTDQTSTFYCYRSNIVTYERYKFKFVANEHVVEYETYTNNFRFMDVEGVRPYETYNVSVAVMVNGKWSPYGTSCTIHTALTDLEGPIAILDTYCDRTYDDYETLIYCTRLVDYEAYKFELVQGENVFVYESPFNKFNLGMIDGILPGFFNVRAAGRKNGVWSNYGKSCQMSFNMIKTSIVSSQCNMTAYEDDTKIYAIEVDGAESYRYTLRNNNLYFTYETPNNYFQFSEIAGVVNDTQYEVYVQVKVNNIWSNSGGKCVVFARLGPIYLYDDYCGNTLSALNYEMYTARTVNRSDILNYQYEVTDEEGVVHNHNSDKRTLRLTDVEGLIVTYNKNYSIRVAHNLKNGTNFGYGSSCIVRTPNGTGLIGLIGSATSAGWDSDIDMNLSGDGIYSLTTDLVVGEAKFRENNDWMINWGGESLSSGMSGKAFVGGVNFIISEAGTYDVTFNINTLEYSFVKVSSPRFIGQFNEEIKLVVFPNPYTDTFQISYPTDSEGTVNVSIYDMSGRQVAQSQHEAATLSEQYFGQGLSAGIYNVILEHGTEVKTLRVVRQ